MQSIDWFKASPGQVPKRRVRFDIPISDSDDESTRTDGSRRELLVLSKAKDAGIAYMLSHPYVKAKKTSSIVKKLAINYAYTFLRKNSRDPALVFKIPHTSLIEVGMFYYV